MDGQQLCRSNVTAQNLPGEVLERVLAHVPFHDRVSATAVCRAWHRHLSQRGLLLWQAADIVKMVWDMDDTPYERYGVTEQDMELFLPLQRWLCRHGGGLLQLQCSTPFDSMMHCQGVPDDSLLAAFLATLAASAPSLQALRLDDCATWDFAAGSLFSMASMGSRLRQLAPIGLRRVSDESLAAALAQLPMLQDLAVIYEDEGVRMHEGGSQDWQAAIEPPDMMYLLNCCAASCMALHMLALGHLPGPIGWSSVLVNGELLPESMSRLTVLSSLTLQNVGWEYAPGGLPHLPQLRRLNLRGDSTQESREGSELQHQLSSLTALEALQVMHPDWPGRLPRGLTQLVLAPLDMSSADHPNHVASGFMFLRNHLPPLRVLRHLAFHGLSHIGEHLLQDVCAAAAALPHLISLHLVKCNVAAVPVEMCQLSLLQLLNLSHNWPLQSDGHSTLAQAPLHKLTSCRRLDLRCKVNPNLPFEFFPLRRATVVAIADMPALEQLALPLMESNMPALAAAEEAQLAQCRGPGLPPIRVVAEMPQSDRWGAVDVELPFAEVNDVLGVQLERSVARGVQIDQ